MRQINIILFSCLLALLMFSCIKPFYPEISSKDVNKYVVNGQVDNQGGIQTVTISKTSPIQDPAYIPVLGCSVKIMDDKGHEFQMTEASNGNYEAVIDQSYVTPGSSFKVEIITPDEVTIVSDFDRVNSSPLIDSLYFVPKSIPTSDPAVYQQGIQYYINLNGNDADSRYYRWEGVETWEYHAEHPLIWYYDGTVHQVWPPDSSKMVCWRTQVVSGVFTLSTRNLSENKYSRLPLQYVDNKTSRLAYGYSLLVRQIALSEEAYIYWDNMRINSMSQGGLYEKQPLSIKGNLHNLTHPDQDVLGFFSASCITSKRIFTGPIHGLVLDFSTFCSPVWLGKGGLANIFPYEYPAALVGDQYSYTMFIMNNECVDCTTLGGTTVKPDFWPY